MLIVPVPCFGVDGLADTTKDTKGAQIMLLNMILTQAPEETDCSGSRVELGELVLLDGLPVTRRGGVYRSRLKDSRGDTKGERAVHNVTGRTSGS